MVILEYRCIFCLFVFRGIVQKQKDIINSPRVEDITWKPLILAVFIEVSNKKCIYFAIIRMNAQSFVAVLIVTSIQIANIYLKSFCERNCPKEFSFQDELIVEQLRDNLLSHWKNEVFPIYE